MFLNIARLLLMTATAMTSLFAWDSVWIPAIPWAICCFYGVVLAAPIVLGVGMLSAGAQADWMSDEFMVTLLFVLPTVLSMLVKPTIRLIQRMASDNSENADRPTMPSSVPLTRGTPPAGQEPRLGSRSAHG